VLGSITNFLETADKIAVHAFPYAVCWELKVRLFICMRRYLAHASDSILARKVYKMMLESTPPTKNSVGRQFHAPCSY